MKNKLDELLLDLSSDTHYLEKQTVKDVQSLIKFWNWKFTACDIFVIDRSLVSGVYIYKYIEMLFSEKKFKF